MEKKTLPFGHKVVIRVLIGIIFVLSLVVGYYYTKYGELQKSYNRLNTRYQNLLEE